MELGFWDVLPWGLIVLMLVLWVAWFMYVLNKSIDNTESALDIIRMKEERDDGGDDDSGVHKPKDVA